MTRAYASFPAGGRKVEAKFVTQVSSGDGAIILDATKPVPGVQALEPAVAYVMADMMKAVVLRGTGRKALLLGRPVGGKTGTATGYRDAWFIGFTADLVCGVWVGRDNFKPIGDDTTGGGVALPIWLQFMQAAHPQTPVRDFPPPTDVTFVRADEMTGAAAAPTAPHALWIPFVRGTVPDRFTARVDSRDFATSTGSR
jgi:penicillin-binding protein 1A